MDRLDKAVFGIKINAQGELQIYNLEKFKEMLLHSKGWKGTITFEQKAKTNLQGMINLYNWWLSIFEEDTGATVEEMDLFLREQFATTVKSYPKIGTRRVLIALEDMNFNELLEFLKKVHYWALTDLGIEEERMPIANLKL